MSQNGISVADGSGSTVRGEINLALQDLATQFSGNSAPSPTAAYQWWADTTSGLLKQRNAANSGWVVRGTLAEAFVISKSSGYTVAVGDFEKVFKCSGSFTLAFTAAGTLGDGFVFTAINTGSGSVVLDPNGSEQIDNATTVTLEPGEGCRVECDGSAFFSIGRTPVVSVSVTAPITNTGTAKDPNIGIAVSAHSMVVGNGSGVIAGVAPGTSGNVATSNGTDWTSAAPSVPTAFGAVGTPAIGFPAGAVVNNTTYSAATAGISGGSGTWRCMGVIVAAVGGCCGAPGKSLFVRTV